MMKISLNEDDVKIAICDYLKELIGVVALKAEVKLTSYDKTEFAVWKETTDKEGDDNDS